MTRRPSATLAIVGAIVWATSLIGMSPTPMAHADDPLGPIRAAVNGERAKSPCPALKYSSALEGAAQAAARFQGDVVYLGTKKEFTGFGDPASEALNDALDDRARAAIADCSYTEYGVGFFRADDYIKDRVSIMLGTPRPEPPRPNTPPAPSAPPTGSVPSPAPAPPKVAPTDAIRVSFDKGLQWTVNVTSTADIPGKCTFAATNPILPATNRTFDIAPKGTASFVVLAPPPFATYHVMVSCRGPWEGINLEFGRVEQDVAS